MTHVEDLVHLPGFDSAGRADGGKHRRRFKQVVLDIREPLPKIPALDLTSARTMEEP